MRWNRIELKLGLAILTLFLITLLPLVIAIYLLFADFYYSQVQDQIDQQSKNYADAIRTLDDNKILSMYEVLAKFTHTELYIVDESGVVVANSGLEQFPKGSVLHHHYTEELLNGREVHSRYIEPTTEKHYLASGRPIYSSNKEVIGGVFVLATVAEINASIKQIRTWLIIALISVFLVAFGFTYLISKILSRPLVAMEKATRQIAKNELDIRMDVTSNDEIGSLAKAINDLAKELEGYRRNRREFFANISHELRTPISYIQGYAEILKEHLYTSKEEKNKYLIIIHDEANRMVNLINDLFDLSKMEEGKIDLHFAWIDIDDLIEGSIHKMKLKAKGKGLDIKVQIIPNLPMIYSDGMRMEQILINLIENAIRYTEEGTINVKVWSEKNGIKISIDDTGIGIPECDLPLIFERFYRVEKSRSRELGGTGLGLTIVKQLVDLLKGDVSVYSQVGKGTTFILFFPTEKMKVT